MDGDDGGVMAQPTFMLHQPSEPKKKIHANSAKTDMYCNGINTLVMGIV
jgi:hypothetical protein